VHKENNAANEEIDPDTLPWRDTHVRIRGPVAAEFEKLFMLTWYQQKGDRLNDPPPTHIDASDGLLVQAIDGTPGENRYTIYRSLLTAITLARSSVHLTTAFFVPTPDLIHALEEAAERGADVVLVLPSESTSDFALKAGHAYYEDLMEAGVKIYERKGAILHAKTAVVDGIWSTVGSSNLDWRSVLFNNECNAVILGPAFGEKMESMFRDDVQQSQYIDPKTWSQRSMWQSLDEWKAKILEYFL
jgi:cardiolipin synthase